MLGIHTIQNVQKCAKFFHIITIVISCDCFRWYHGRIDREAAEKLLMESGNVDSFLVRESVHFPGDYSISVRCGEKNITSIHVDYKVLCPLVWRYIVKEWEEDSIQTAKSVARELPPPNWVGEGNAPIKLVYNPCQLNQYASSPGCRAHGYTELAVSSPAVNYSLRLSVEGRQGWVGLSGVENVGL